MTPPNPGEGYRLLSGDEILQEGDEVYSHGYWYVTECDGEAVHGESGTLTLIYRRKLEADK